MRFVAFLLSMMLANSKRVQANAVCIFYFFDNVQ